MPHTRFDRDIDAWLPDRGVDDSRTPPYTWYTDPAFFEEEVGRVFQKSWMPVGRTEQVTKPGDYFTGELLQNPYLVVRGQDEKLYAHHNVCRHKGCVVAEQEDESLHNAGNHFRCPFHGWEYHFDGRLKRAPSLGKLKSFAPERYGLAPIAVDQWGPFVFIDLDGPFGGQSGKPRDLMADVGPVADHLQSTGLEKLRFYKQTVYELNCNWKVFVDNSLDSCYHCQYAHCDSIGSNLADVETHIYDRSSIQIGNTTGRDERLGEKVYYAYIFPNLFINRYGSMMDVNIVEPIAVDKCRVIFDFYFEFENFDDWQSKNKMRKQMAAANGVQEEDIHVCEATQRGMNSMSWKWGRYSSTLEEAVYAFHVLLWHELRGLNYRRPS